MFVLVIYTLTKHMPSQRARQNSRIAGPPVVPATVNGTVHRVIHDGSIYLALIREPSRAVWVGIMGAEPVLGQTLTCSIERSIEAYESKTDGMAFERILIASDVSLS